ncbi:MAG TPA: LuxR family transcriptional regulator [Rhizomicrobium sp.]|jgi:LuxR family quorum-sensing system transcriptional regulator CciR|nr:LuxR family transcriptional regulator [Rhizomicrobium sp.]
MSLLEDVQEFVREANRIVEIKDLQTLLEGTVRELGFDYFALVHHVNIYQTSGEVVYLFDFPPAWAELVDRKGYFTDDPVHVACQKSAAPFTWADVPQLITLTTRQAEMLQAAKSAGLGGGFTVPIHIPGEYTGSCTFSTRAGREIPQAALPAAHYVGSFAFEAARRVVQRVAAQRGTRNKTVAQPKLTRRQLDCVVLAGRGKSDKDVAQILGISGQTVHQHMEDAKRKYDVATRMQLIVRALFDSQLAFADLVN